MPLALQSGGGNVGIGTTTPTAPLHVSGTAVIGQPQRPLGTLTVSTPGYATLSLQSEYNLGPTGIRFWGAGDRGSIYADGAYNFYIQPNAEYGGGHILMYATSGTTQVGIATLTPTTALEVSGTISATNLVINGVSITGGAQADRITSGTTAVTVNSATATISFTTNGSVANYVDSSGRLVTTGISVTTDQLSATTGYFSGNVGIGTASPQNTLDLGSGSGWNSVGLGYQGSFIGFNAYWNGTWQYKSSGYASVIRQGTDGLEFWSAPTGSGTMSPVQALIIDTTGQAGIGTANPTANLEVSGMVSATHFVGDGSGLTGLSARGDRITSGTASVIANQNTGVSVSAPMEVSGDVAATGIKLASASTVTCDAAHNHTIIWDDATGSLLVCRM